MTRARALLAVIVVSCGGHRAMDTHPALVVDSSFTSAERAQVNAAVAAWEAADPHVRFTVRAADHATVGEEGTTSPADDTIYLQRLTPAGCSANLETWVGVTVWTENYATLTCIDADVLDAESNVRPLGLQAVVTHELGHSLGLWHIDEGVPSHPASIMTTYHQDEPANARPTCLDVKDVAQVNGLGGVDCADAGG